MIPRITRGGSAYGALSYDHGPGRADEHHNPHKVAGNVAGRTWKQRSATIDSHVQRMHPKLSNPIIRTSLRIAPEDRRLTDREWRAVANEYVKKMGYENAPWEAVRHADDHIHLTMSRVNWDGSVVDQWRDKTKAQTVVRDIERRHHLIDASARYNRDAPQLSRNDRERAQRQSEQSGRRVVPEKAQLREHIDAAQRSCDGTRSGFETELAKRGVTARANVSKPTERNPYGKVNGYSYRLDGHTDAAGKPVEFKGSDLGQKYAWSRTRARLDERAIEVQHSPNHAPPQPQSAEGKTARSDVAAVPVHQPQNPDTARSAARALAEQRAAELRQSRQQDRSGQTPQPPANSVGAPRDDQRQNTPRTRAEAARAQAQQRAEELRRRREAQRQRDPRDRGGMER